ncbi:MAG: ABC transporter ATP-binding protein [Clostridium sp.]|uniref:ABC transporter ATP-binding protein n=1 Tax=Clostridium sp. TaxID=1506 RepID=UPI003F2C8A04
MKEIIVVENLSKEYIIDFKYKIDAKEGKPTVEKKVVKALDKVNFEIDEGEFIAIMGPSGSGKSTFVNMISTIDTPSGGKVKINGKNVLSLRTDELSKLRYETIGFVFQDFNLLDNLTIFENISVPLKLAGVSKEQISERISELAKKLMISELLEKYPNECSGGQIQRCSIARALINNPKIIIADEPTGNLDSENSKNILRLLKELNESLGITVLIVTHDPLTASYSRKVVNLRDGKIEKSITRDSDTQREYFNRILDLVSGDIDL